MISPCYPFLIHCTIHIPYINQAAIYWRWLSPVNLLTCPFPPNPTYRPIKTCNPTRYQIPLKCCWSFCRGRNENMGIDQHGSIKAYVIYWWNNPQPVSIPSTLGKRQINKFKTADLRRRQVQNVHKKFQNVNILQF